MKLRTVGLLSAAALLTASAYSQNTAKARAKISLKLVEHGKGVSLTADVNDSSTWIGGPPYYVGTGNYLDVAKVTAAGKRHAASHGESIVTPNGSDSNEEGSDLEFILKNSSKKWENAEVSFKDLVSSFTVAHDPGEAVADASAWLEVLAKGSESTYGYVSVFSESDGYYGGAADKNKAKDSGDITLWLCPGQTDYIFLDEGTQHMAYASGATTPGPAAVAPFVVGLIGAIRRRKQ